MVSDVVELCAADVPLELLLDADGGSDSVEWALPAVSLFPLPVGEIVVSPSTACGVCLPPGLKSALVAADGRDGEVPYVELPDVELLDGDGVPITGLAVGAAGANDVSAGAVPDCP
jgi:hypothetical protein